MQGASQAIARLVSDTEPAAATGGNHRRVDRPRHDPAPTASRACLRRSGSIPGVTGVSVDLQTGALTIKSKEPVPVEAVQAAVDKAGYTLAR
jgi:hypothetical protein